MEKEVERDLVDFDNYLDDITQDWTNLGIERLISSFWGNGNVNYAAKTLNTDKIIIVQPPD